MPKRGKPYWRNALAITLLCIAFVLGANRLSISLQNNQPTETKGAEIRRTESPQETGNNQTGIKAITYHLYGNKANRLGERRNPQKIREFPELFGPEKPFPPLITLMVQGPGNVYLEGDGPTGTISFHVKPGTWQVEVYPYYHLNTLKAVTEDETEEITASFEGETGKQDIQNRETITWSQPRDFFRNKNRIQDLAALSIAQTKGNPSFGPDQLENWLQQEANSIGALNLLQETQREIKEETEGWQKIRSQEEMEQEKRANCIEIALLVARNALQTGLETKLTLVPGHAFVIVNHPDRPEKSLYLEGTRLLHQKTEAWAKIHKQKTDEEIKREIEAINRGEKKPQATSTPWIDPAPQPKNLPPPKIPENESPNAYSIPLNSWSQLYR